MATRTLKLDDALLRYIDDHSLREHPAQAALREATRSHPHAGMQIGADQGQFMALLVKLIGARRTIEIGTFTGYSALAVALALPADGRVLACDISDEYTRVGKPFWKQAGRRAQDRAGARARRLPRSMRGSRPARRAATTSRSSTPTRPATTATTNAACNCCAPAG